MLPGTRTTCAAEIPLSSILPIVLLLLSSVNMLAESSSTAPHSNCDRHAELLKGDHMVLGARIDTANPVLAKQFRRALDFWTSVLDLEWHEENSIACSLQLTDAPNGFLDTSIAAQAQDPQSADFQGWIEFDAAAALTETEMYYYSVHEIGHLLGLGHNPSHRSVMYFKDAPGPERLDTTDLMALATIHKLRLTSTSRAIYLQKSVWNHAPDFQQMRERILMNRFPSGLMTMLATGKRAPHARTPAQIAGNAEPCF
jgi:Matrixin